MPFGSWAVGREVRPENLRSESEGLRVKRRRRGEREEVARFRQRSSGVIPTIYVRRFRVGENEGEKSKFGKRAGASRQPVRPKRGSEAQPLGRRA
uniref:Uncharacterized protein n=1 Tax=Solanum tuberosum TaxID=4113 RepID=M1DZ12_SOLTU